MTEVEMSEAINAREALIVKVFQCVVAEINLSQIWTVADKVLRKLFQQLTAENIFMFEYKMSFALSTP